MTQKSQVLICFSAFIVAFAIGRYSVPSSSKTTSDTQVHENIDDKVKTDLERDRHRETTVTEVVKPDGTKETVTKTVENSTTKKKTDAEKTDATSTETKTSTEVVRAGSQITVAALMGTNLNLGSITYGGIVSRPILGPITMGVFGLQPGVFGLAIGLTF